MFDPLRKKNVADTPEEQVRQHIIRWLNREKGVSLNLMMSEYSFTFNTLTYRSDIVVFDKKGEPLMLVECKAPSVKLDKEVMEQGLRYNRILNVKFMMFSNGNTTFFCRLDKEKKEYIFLNEVPSYSEMIM